jgi:hypothetical protein
MVTTQSAVTVMAEILAGHEGALRHLLETAGQDAANNSLVPVGKLAAVHFARFFMLDAARTLDGQPLTPRLVFLSDVDGPADAFLMVLCGLAGDGLDTIYQHCQGYPGRSGLLEFLRAHTIPVAAHYVNTIGRTVQQIQQEAALHDALEDFLNRTKGQWLGAAPRRVRAAIQEFVEHEPALAWARRPVPPHEPAYVLGEKLHFFVVAAAGIVLFPAILAALPVWLILLRRHEKADVAADIVPTDAWRETLAAQEDHGVQNPFTSVGYIKPGPFRRYTGIFIQWATNFLARHIFNHANLIGVKTIHFAEWVFIDDKHRLFFTSNYDGSLENYMDDFVDKIAWALNASFSHGVDYPRTNWLILDGAYDEQVFKRFNVMHQLVAPFWYAAYQGLTALNIDNNAEIRAGLYGAMDDAAARAWLRRF